MSSAHDLHIRRVRRGDLDDIAALLETACLPPPPAQRGGLKRFRNIVGDQGCDFDVAIQREVVRGFVHVTYARDLLLGNRGQLLALVYASEPVGRALLQAALERAVRRHCRDVTAIAGPWLKTDAGALLADWQPAGSDRRIDLTGGGEPRDAGDLPAAAQTCRG